MSSDHGNEECENMPQRGFTQRATIDCEKDEIYVLTVIWGQLFFEEKRQFSPCLQSLSKEKERKDLNYNVLWMFSLKTNQWSCIYRCNHSKLKCFTKVDEAACAEPCPRFAHQLVYDMNSKTHYLFGGNPGNNAITSLRLDDFWLLRLER